MKIDFNFQPDSKVTLAANGRTETVDLWSRAHKLFEGHAGRINVYDQALSNPSSCKTVARADGKTTLNAVGETGPAEIAVSLPEGRKGLVRLSARGQADGFASGEGYWLAQDAGGRFKPTPGRRHRKIYVSGSASAMTVAMIAAHAGVTSSTVTGSWLAARPQYGGSEAMPIASDAYLLLADATWGKNRQGRSDWVRFERGYTYPQIRSGLGNGNNFQGESELHPLVFEAYGSGPLPIISKIEWTNMGPKHVVFRDLASPYVNLKQIANIIFEGIDSYGADYFQMGEGHGVTVKDGSISDHRRLASKNGGAWEASQDRLSGSLFSSIINVVADGVVVDYNAWTEGYSYDMLEGPMPPSYYSHGLYWTHNNRNLTLRDMVISRNASCGLQVRCGGHFERILFLYNNIAFGGDSEPYTNFTALLDSVAFGSGHKEVKSYEGAIAVGFDLYSNHPVQLGCVVAHDADPANPAERTARKSRNTAFRGQPAPIAGVGMKGGFADTQTYNWNAYSAGIEGLDEKVLNNTTIQKLGGEFMGRPSATLNEVATYLKGNHNRIREFTQFVIRKTKANFGRPLPAVRATPASLIFLPDPQTEGFRWDNRRNWSTLDLPGAHVADSVDLDGNLVRFGTLTTSIAALKSKGGILDVTSGKLTVGAVADPAEIRVRGSGQFIAPATTQPLSIKADSGLAHLTGTVSNLDLEVRGHAEMLLGPDCTVPAGKSLIVSGQRPLIGWDGTGSATLTVAGTLEFRAGLMLTSNTAQKQSFLITGNRITGTNFSATLADYEEISTGTNNRLWLTEVTGLPVAGETFVFGYRQEYADKVDLTAAVTAVASRGVAPLQRFRSGTIGDGLTDPTVAATVRLSAGSQVVIGGRDLLTPGTYDLTGPGVTVVDSGATLPAGVSITDGKLVLVVS